MFTPASEPAGDSASLSPEQSKTSADPSTTPASGLSPNGSKLADGGSKLDEDASSPSEQPQIISVEADEPGPIRDVREFLKRAEMKKNGKAHQEDEEDSGSDSDKSTRDPVSFYNNAAQWKVNYASELNSEKLYEAYRQKLLRRKPRPIGPAATHYRSSNLIKGMVDYLQNVETRMNRLETSRPPPPGHAQNVKHDPTDGAGEKDENATAMDDIVLEMKFYPCKDALDELGNNLTQPDVPGAYTCNTDPKYLIRILYNWTEEAARAPPVVEESSGSLPPPEKLDIVAFMVHSKALASFYKDRLGLEPDITNVLRFGKPFRSLIRNLAPLRAQLALLEKKYGPSESPAATSPGDMSLHATHETNKDAPTSSPQVKTEDEKIEEYNLPYARSHFHLLLHFADTYLRAQVSLFESLQAGKGDKIAFQNLWMLFDVGETIYNPFQGGGDSVMTDEPTGPPIPRGPGYMTKKRHVPQAFRVVATIGGVPFRRSLAPQKAILPEEDVSDAVFQIFMDSTSAQVKVKEGGQKRTKNNYTLLFVLCMYFDFDGEEFDTDGEIFLFRPFDGEMDIRDLDAFPLRFLNSTSHRTLAAPKHSAPGENETGGDSGDDKEQTQFFIERGRKFVEVTKVSHRLYDGLTIGKNREEISSPVIVDLKLAFQEYNEAFSEGENEPSIVPPFTSLQRLWPRSAMMQEVFDFHTSCGSLYCHNTRCLFEGYNAYQRKQLDKIQDASYVIIEEIEKLYDQDDGVEKVKQYMEGKDLIKLLPGAVPAFALRSRSWVLLDLTLLEYVKQEDDWDRLVLPRGHKEIVRAMVETHSQGSRSPDKKKESLEMDLVRGKGKGCIILLHGVPGVGKTSTAECVASNTKRALYPITCGDIGYSPEDVEDNMGKHFKLAHKWGCVLLLDEADVFLAKRNKADVKRNGLVSVFLRILEYYSGILFLTTNRVGAIDDAFRSRLHLTLYYPALTKRRAIKIWGANLNQLKVINEERQRKGYQPIEFNEKKLINWAKRHWGDIRWNGRQIRNAFQTAAALAEFKAKETDARHQRAEPSTPVMETGHFKLIANASMQFSEYLQETHGEDEETMAVRDQIRTTSFKPKKKIKELSDSDDSESSSSSEGSSSDDSSGHDASGDSDSDSDDSSAKKKKKKKKAKKGKAKASKEEKKDKKGKDKKK